MNNLPSWLPYSILVVLFVIWLRTKIEFFTPSDNNIKNYIPNQNAFRNYYRIGYESSQTMGWKPSETWDHLRPEYSEQPNCYHKDRIY